jgi:NAD(P)-dependent dehydrogenase (short-subunit alcohol dehydrogenase family)
MIMKPSFDDLKGKIAVITGGAGIIGSSLAESFAQLGTKIIILDRDENKAVQLAAEIQRNTSTECFGILVDVLDKSSLESALLKIHTCMGKIDILINAAGGNHPSATTAAEFAESGTSGEWKNSFFGLELEGFRKVFELNFMGTILPTMVLSKDMVESGKGAIMNISSMNSFRPLTRIPAYSAAKASINNFTQWLAVHFAKTGVRVNAIAPGFLLTDQNRFLLIDEKTGELSERGRKILDATPNGRFGETADLSGTAAWLLSDNSSFVTGIVVPVDGGFSAYSGV